MERVARQSKLRVSDKRNIFRANFFMSRKPLKSYEHEMKFKSMATVFMLLCACQLRKLHFVSKYQKHFALSRLTHLLCRGRETREMIREMDSRNIQPLSIFIQLTKRDPNQILCARMFVKTVNSFPLSANLF